MIQRVCVCMKGGIVVFLVSSVLRASCACIYVFLSRHKVALSVAVLLSKSVFTRVSNVEEAISILVLRVELAHCPAIIQI